jgi:hypothetical protein
MKTRSLLSLVAALSVVFFLCTPVHADSILNGDFATGTLAGWTVFTTSNGTNGAGLPNVVSFDTTGTGASNAAHFNVGAVNFDSTQQGGGLFQSVLIATAGLYNFSADIAAQGGASDNAAAGLFSILIDGNTVASVDLGFIPSSQILRGTLSGSANLTAASHGFAVQITRPYLQGNGTTPDQYIDNITLNTTATPTPEPSTLLSLATGLLGLMGMGLRRKRLA